ncbi:MAG: tripartite tricarboxylate transporter TctB family protein [Candidatus Krumholzibacteria bacterium]|nr:tripartite tricarboxylate transporter TctB family protein [Candidatus Krumholzibacteria bacterium]
MTMRLTMRILGMSALMMAAVVFAQPPAPRAAYPDKPIVIIVHAKPGGAIDLTARVVSKVARKYTDAPMVIENRYGGSGAVAMRAVLGRKADGYTVLASPATFISTVQITQSDFGMEDFYFLACLTEAPEALITNRHSDVVTFEDIVADARAKEGRQIWVGPGVGSLDHLMAIKTWDKLGITATWVPYDGGGEAIAALLGKHGDVYVGNPEDVKGRPDLKIAVVSARERLKNFPETPTLLEVGCDLPDEIMWRGFAVKQGTPPDVIAYLDDLLGKVARDEEWLAFVKLNSAKAVHYRHDEFTAIVNRDSHQSVKYLQMANILASETDQSTNRIRIVAWSMIPIIALAIALVLRLRRRRPAGVSMIAGACLALAVLFFVLAFSFPPPTKGQNVGAATIPLIWSAVLAVFAVLQIRADLVNHQHVKHGRVNLVLGLILLMVVFVAILPLVGFFPATLILLLGGIYAMGYRRHGMAAAVAVSMLVFCYVIFIRTLGLPLPEGSWFQ